MYRAFSTPDKAIDGNTDGNYYSETMFVSGEPGAGEYLNVAFAPSNLSSVTIFGRNDCCSERDFYNIEIFNAAGALLYSGQLDARLDHSASVVFDTGVPEPASWALMIAGFGLVGGALRRRSVRIAA